MSRAFVLTLLVGGGAAAADTPTFVSLDRATGTSNFGAHLGVMLFEDSDSDGGQPTLQQPRLQLFGEYAASDEVGLVASASVIWFHAPYASELGLGSTYVGGYGRYVAGALEILGRASLVLPTESFVSRDNYFRSVSIHGTLFPWLEERAADAGVFWLHAGGTMRYRANGWIAQLDAYATVPLGTPGEESYDVPGESPKRLHFGAGVAYAPAPARWRVGLELLLSGYLLADSSGNLDGDEGHWLAATLSAAYTFDPRSQGVVWFGSPLNEYLRSRWHAIGVGYQVSL